MNIIAADWCNYHLTLLQYGLISGGWKVLYKSSMTLHNICICVKTVGHLVLWCGRFSLSDKYHIQIRQMKPKSFNIWRVEADWIGQFTALRACRYSSKHST